MYDKIMGSSWVFGLIVVSGIFGAILTFLVFLLLVRATGASVKVTMNREWFYTGVLTGIFERFFFTCTIGLVGGGSGAVAGMITWIAVKGQVHYKIFSEKDQHNMPQVYLGLLGSLTSLLFAVLGGYLWEHGHTLAHPLIGQKP
jgi:hypothetical protein